MKNILNEIIVSKSENIKKYKNSFKIEDLKNKISSYKNYFDFKEKLNKNKLSIIAEIKKASPSAGVIVENYDPKIIAKQYSNSGACCLSILTEENYFKGKLEDITYVKKEVKLPVLCKDFFIDPYQVYLAKSFGADAILIILAAIDENTAKSIYSVSQKLNMSTIVEVHTVEEAKKALDFENAIIGINNRNLKTLETDIRTTLELYKILNNHTGPIVCESGIKSERDVEEILKKTKIKNFLIGESLLKDLNEKTPLLERILKIAL
ncbi:MAG: indole-3-glycerol phosphate synthase [Candidatus Marinimicrobia bacterium]|nr:indole-3-glycerol phosphate synthase [Candidatus Neomarinimicrobiota bacterium]|tara:strand:+ start:8266 stop:9060 length:795 start_codon:yes stop_codon:yes gene_type:complete